eukprot:4945436-Prymnesium_polylepis.1
MKPRWWASWRPRTFYRSAARSQPARRDDDLGPPGVRAGCAFALAPLAHGGPSARRLGAALRA